jgi:predicted nucleotidyltransferase
MDANTTKVRTAEELIVKNLLVKHKAGSHAYGTNISTSDEDYRGIFVGDPINIRTPFFKIEEKTDTSEEDTVLYELAQYMKLCLDCNPNIIETLWVHDDDITFRTPAYDLLRSARHELLSSKIAFTTSGYALAQLKRIKGHNKWINNPQPEEQPKPCEHLTVVQWLGRDKNLHPSLSLYRNEYRLIPFGNEMYGVVQSSGHKLWDDNGNLNDKFEGDRAEHNNTYLMVVKWNRDEFKTRLEKWQQYWTWKRERNKTRSALEEEHGYDTKHAMHLVRLLRMGVEALRDGEIYVRRPDAQELLSIRNGAWSYESLVAYAEDMDKQVCEVWYPKTKLRKTPDLLFAAYLVMQVQDSVWSK